jgi:probable HAF family extracellular repeat protein
MRKKTLLTISLPLALLVILLGWKYLSGGREVRYQVIDLGNLGGTPVEVHGINNSGQVVGRVNTDDVLVRHAFVWDATGGLTDLSALLGFQGEAVDINDRGEVVGFITLPGPNGPMSGHHAFYWNRETGMIDLHPEGFDSSWARLINNNGTIVGHGINSPGGKQEHQAYLWENPRASGKVISGTENFFIPEAINDRGEISGRFHRGRIRDKKDYSAMMRSSTGELVELSIPEDCWSCETAVMDESGTVTAVCRDGGSDPVAFVRWRGTFESDRVAFKFDCERATPVAANTKGDTLVMISQRTIDPLSRLIRWGLKPFDDGRMADSRGPKSRADRVSDFLYKAGVYKGEVHRKFPVLWNGESFSDLNDLIPSISGWELEEAGDINEQGQIVGKGKHNGVYGAFLLNPLPPKLSRPWVPEAMIVPGLSDTSLL